MSSHTCSHAQKNVLLRPKGYVYYRSMAVTLPGFWCKRKTNLIMKKLNSIWKQAFIFITHLIIFRVVEFILTSIVLRKHRRGRHRVNTPRHPLTLTLIHVTCMCFDCREKRLCKLHHKKRKKTQKPGFFLSEKHLQKFLSNVTWKFLFLFWVTIRIFNYVYTT